MFFTFHLTNQNKQYCSGTPPYGHLGNMPVTLLLRPLFFWPPDNKDHTFSCKEILVNNYDLLVITANFFLAYW